jgi:threonine/homoserine/homoserine lactone efflux protein
MNNLLNANAYLFTLAVIPQFMRAEYGPLWLQGIVLWCLGAICQFTIYGSVALLASTVRARLERDPSAAVRVGRVVGVMLVLAAAVAAVSGWRNG